MFCLYNSTFLIYMGYTQVEITPLSPPLERGEIGFSVPFIGRDESSDFQFPLLEEMKARIFSSLY
ncbi:hypothetical protein NUACC26_023500 [Scytonema sp. NUACC26]